MEDISPFCGATGTPLDFGQSHSGFPQLPTSSTGFVIHPQVGFSPDPG